MSELVTLARPYAAAVFKRAKEAGSAPTWSENLAFLAVVMSDPDIVKAVNNPKLGKDKLGGLIFGVCEGHIDAEGANLVKLLLQNARLGLLPDIAAIFEEMRAEDEGYIQVNVLTAFPFEKDAQKKLSAKLEKKLNKKIHMNMAIDKSLIGGVLVRAGDRVIDGSIRGQLQNLRKALL
jgi:F-type H+-transporting ATPase subunit delta